MDDLGPNLGLELALPGWDERSVGDDLAGRVDETNVFKDVIGNLIFWGVGHRLINAYLAGIGKGSRLTDSVCGSPSHRVCEGAVQ